MTIRIVNLRTYKPVSGEVLIKVDRSTPVGNPFYMKDESMRDEVCRRYDSHFPLYMQNNKAFSDYINHIVDVAKKHNIALGCWCYPKRCHAETIKAYIVYPHNEWW